MNVEQPTFARSDETQLLAALTEAGFPVSSVAAIRDQYDPLPSGLAALLLEWIPRLEDRRLQESGQPGSGLQISFLARNLIRRHSHGLLGINAWPHS